MKQSAARVFSVFLAQIMEIATCKEQGLAANQSVLLSWDWCRKPASPQVVLNNSFYFNTKSEIKIHFFKSLWLTHSQ